MDLRTLRGLAITRVGVFFFGWLRQRGNGGEKLLIEFADDLLQ
jgi:hypothetical protein